MPDFTSSYLPPPKDWEAFERATRVLFQCILNDPNTQRNGRTGQAQNGVDVYGRRNKKKGHWVGVQCKGKDLGLGRELSEKEVLDEVDKARRFKPKLKEFIIVTTAGSADDNKLQQLAREITDANANTDHPFEVLVWGWDTLQEHIAEHQKAIRAFHPDASPFTDQIIEKIDAIKDDQLNILNTMQTGFRDTQRVVSTTKNHLLETAGKSDPINKAYNDEIDTYRELVRANKPATGLEMLNKLKERIWNEASDRLKFRLLSNIGAAELDLGDEVEAAKKFLSAAEYYPDDRNAQAQHILAHILLGDFQTAISIGKQEVDKHPSNTHAILQLLQAAARDGDIKDPWSIIPKASHSFPEALFGISIFYRYRGDERWTTVAQDAARKFPDNDELVRVAAEAIIEGALHTPGVMLGEQSDKTIDFEELSKACNKLLVIWTELADSEVGAIDASLPHNLAQGFRLLGREDQATAILDRAIERIGNHPDLIRTRAVLHVNIGELDSAEYLLEKIPDDPDASLFHAELLIRRDPEQARELLKEIESKVDDEQHHHITRSLIVESYIKGKEPGRAIEYLEPLVKAKPGDTELLVLLARIQLSQGDPDAGNTLSSAMSSLSTESSFFIRFELADMLYDHQRNDDAADILDGHVDVSRNSPPLRFLIRALINSGHRTKPREIIEALPEDVRNLPYYLRSLAGIHDNRGDLQGALDAIEAYLQQCPNDLSARHQWARLLFRLGQEEKVKFFLKSDLDELEGNPDEKLELAFLLAHFKESERALELGYRILVLNPDKPERFLRYIGLIMKAGEGMGDWLFPTSISDNVVFTARNEQGEERKFLIEPDPDLRRDDFAVASDHAFAKAAMGLKIGEAFSVTSGRGQTKHWEVFKIVHKYVAVHQRIVESMEWKFPEFTEFERLTYDEKAEDPLADIKERTKSHSEGRQKILDLVEKKRWPLEVAASFTSADTISIWQSLQYTGHIFHVCDGFGPEREQALATIRKNAEKGCVIDYLTAHIIRRLEVEDTIATVCGNIGVTQTTIDLFRQRLQEIPQLGGQAGSMAWRDGHLVFQEFTEENRSELISQLEGDIEWLSTKCELLIAEASDEIPQGLRAISSVVGYHFLDPILAADRTGRLLLIEEQAYRLFGANEFHVPTSWLQPVLMTAKNSGVLSRECYCEAIIQLAASHHKFTSVDVGTLIYASDELLKGKPAYLESAFSLIGGETADMRSHLRIAISFFRHIWRIPNPEIERQAHTGILLENLIRDRSTDWQEILSFLENNTSSIGSGFGPYLKTWRMGHFL